MRNIKIANAIEKFKLHQKECHEEHLKERQKYLKFCKKESDKILNTLMDDILDDIELEGVAYVGAAGKYDNIFQFRIGGIVADFLRENGLELTLYPASRIIKVSIDTFGQSED